jgi:hypothetical protein
MGPLAGRWVLFLAIVLLSPPLALADPPEVAPPPRPVPVPPIVPSYQPPVHPQYGQRSVWQLYGVDRTGRFRPLVIQTPYGAFYRFDGSPFPWVNNQTAPYMPYVVD